MLVTVGRWVFWPTRPRYGTAEPTTTGIWARIGAGMVHAHGQSFPGGHGLPDGAAALAIRPRSVMVGDGGSAAGLHFAGRLEEQHLLGEQEQLQVQVPGIGRLVARRPIGEGPLPAVGEDIRLFVPAAAVHVMHS